MSIKRNSIANYIGQSYSILIGIVVTPLYLQYLGAEAYGLVGLFALMQSWMGLLDLGLSPTLSRQIAIARGQKDGFIIFGSLLKSFEFIFIILMMVVVILTFSLSGWISTKWVKAETLDVLTINYVISLMGVMIGLRWFTGLYRSGISGMEHQVWINKASIMLISLKFLGAFFLLEYVSNDVRRFFEYQLLIAVVELFVFGWFFYKVVPVIDKKIKIFGFDWVAVKSVAPFALSIAYTSGLWIMITQTDKVILSGALSLGDFGYFSLVALIAGGIMMISGPITQAILPRVTMLIEQGKYDVMLDIYREGSQVVTLIAFSAALTMGFHGEMLIYAWTGDRAAARWGMDILFWFAMGNALLTIGGFQSLLQTAFGKLRLHVIASTLTALIQVPIIFYAATNYGALGAGVTWFALRLIWLFIYTPIVHAKFLPGFHMPWMLKDIFPIVALTTLVAFIVKKFLVFDINDSRVVMLAVFIGSAIVTFLVSSLSLPKIRMIINKNLRKCLFKI